LEAHYQNEIESIKGKVTRLADLLEQVLSSKNGKGIFAQPLVKTSSIHIPGTSQVSSTTHRILVLVKGDRRMGS
jgi:hypothetical protein